MEGWIEDGASAEEGKEGSGGREESIEVGSTKGLRKKRQIRGKNIQISFKRKRLGGRLLILDALSSSSG